MADIDYDDYGAPPRFTGGQVQRILHLAGAVCSIALIAGVAIWGYRLAVRDVTGIPVIRAAEGPMRVAPQNPGGSIADHQGMAINIVAAAGAAGDLPAEIVLAPPPVDLAAEDFPGLMPLPAPTQTAEAAPVLPLGAEARAEPEVGAGLVVPPPADAPIVAPLALAEPPGAGLPDPAAPSDTEDPVALALAEALGPDALGSEALATEAPASDPLPEAQDMIATNLDVAGIEEGGLTRSIRPMARPGSRLSAVEAAEPVSASLPVANEIDPATLAAGTRLVQLGAFDSPEIARAEWAKVAARFGDLMTGKSLVVQSAQSGGRTFYRLRAHGFEGEDEARRFCAALLAENAACIPVSHR